MIRFVRDSTADPCPMNSFQLASLAGMIKYGVRILTKHFNNIRISFFFFPLNNVM